MLMPHGDLWDAFVRTGRIEDYLRYRGVDIYQHMTSRAQPQGLASTAGKENRPHAADHRRPDHPGKQQYR